MDWRDALDRWIDAHHPEQVAFLSEIVRVPTGMPPGDNAPAAKRAAQLLEAMGFAVLRCPVPQPLVQSLGMKSVTNLVVSLDMVEEALQCREPARASEQAAMHADRHHPRSPRRLPGSGSSGSHDTRSRGRDR